ncbi:hypothetical protein TIFTF001_037054 [Ficus carica]|uniref:ATP-dependent RNA helicase n=1 Tax=Ficus carica TaxID=3494 RepID=A0AA88E962_FICCA|nr:hypothetical protein TIFTF001_037042 [Ficus carica]GMN67996.1 hypothetical protein TIFTF001_037054 [Ficus carica]
MRRPARHQNRLSEESEISLLNSWIQAQKPDSGTNPLSLTPLPSAASVGRLGLGGGDTPSFSRYSGVNLFSQLPISRKTKNGLKQSKYFEMTDIQRASLPHALAGRDILGAAKTGSGKTLAFVIPVLEKLFRDRYTPECGVGAIILCPARELAAQTFEVLKSVGRHHNFSAALIIGGRKEVDLEKECVNNMNIIVGTPGRILQHLNGTVNFDCSELQVLVLDEADRILDEGFKKDLNAIISQLPKKRQTFLFSATQTKSVKDLARLSLKDPEYISVHEESVTATPTGLKQTAIIVPLEEKLDMLWSFIKTHLNSKIIVFLSTRKQVIFVFEAFKKLRPGIPLTCLHGRMHQMKRMAVYMQFCEEDRSVLFCTDVGSRGLDFNKAVHWVVQVDCPDDTKSYIHRVGRTARYKSGGQSLLLLTPSEEIMIAKLHAQKIPIRTTKANTERLQRVSGLLAALLVKFPYLQYKAQRAFITYLKSIKKNKDKEIFDVTKLDIDGFSASLGLPITPKVRFLNKKVNGNEVSGKSSDLEPESSSEDDELELSEEDHDIGNFKGEEVEKVSLLGDDTTNENDDLADITPATRVLKKKKLKINVHRPVGTRVVFDEEGNTLPPLARVAHTENGNDKFLVDKDKREEFYRKHREGLKQVDTEDKLLDRQRRREKRTKEKMKRKRGNIESEEGSDSEQDDPSEEEVYWNKKAKICFGSSDSEGEEEKDNKNKGEEKEDRKERKREPGVGGSLSLEEQEALALKLLSSMHKK